MAIQVSKSVGSANSVSSTKSPASDSPAIALFVTLDPRYQLVGNEGAKLRRAADVGRDLLVALDLRRLGHVATALGVLDADDDQRTHVAGANRQVDRGQDAWMREVLVVAAVEEIEHRQRRGAGDAGRAIEMNAPRLAERLGREREGLVRDLLGRRARGLLGARRGRAAK